MPAHTVRIHCIHTILISFSFFHSQNAVAHGGCILVGKNAYFVHVVNSVNERTEVVQQ